MNRVFHTAFALLTYGLLTACSTPPPLSNPPSPPAIKPCPERPNCVSSLANDAPQRVSPFWATREEDWQRLQQLLLALPRSQAIARSEHYLHVEIHSAILRFRDDVQLWYSPAKQRIDVRSASRLGHYDFGVNRQRIENLRSDYEASAPQE